MVNTRREEILNMPRRTLAWPPGPCNVCNKMIYNDDPFARGYITIDKTMYGVNNRKNIYCLECSRKIENMLLRQLTQYFV
jgi:hypothetical protein